MTFAAYPGLPNIQFPLVGNKWAVGIFFLVHVAFGSFTMGTLVLGPTYELVGRLRGSPALLRYARWTADINLRIFSIGATLAGFAVIFLLGLYGRFFVTLVRELWIPFLIALLIWFPAIAALYVWAHRWERMAPSAGHIGLGYAAAAADHVFLFFIVGVDSFLLTPGSGRGPQHFFNPTFWVELGHRFVGNVSWGSFMLAGIAALLAGSARGQSDRAYFLWAAKLGLLVGFLTMVPQVVLGFAFVETIRHAQPAAFASSFEGSQAWLWLVQGGLLGVIFVAVNLYLRQSRPLRAGRAIVAIVAAAEILAVLPEQVYGTRWFWVRYPLIAAGLLLTVLHLGLWLRAGRLTRPWHPGMAAALAASGVAALSLVFVMGIIRTSARDPYVIYGRMTQTQGAGVYTGRYP